MLFPWSLPAPCGPPTPLALKLRPWFILLVVLLAVVTVLRFVMMDVLDGILMVMLVAIGYYSVSEGMHITYVSIFGMMCFVEVLFDSISLLEKAMRLPVPFFTDKMPWTYNFFHAVMIVAPVLEAIGVALSWQLYTDHEEYAEESQPVLGGNWGQQPNWAPGAGQQGYYGLRPEPQNFQAFQGRGQRLDP